MPLSDSIPIKTGFDVEFMAPPGGGQMITDCDQDG
jgi:hypothetical protein